MQNGSVNHFESRCRNRRDSIRLKKNLTLFFVSCLIVTRKRPPQDLFFSIIDALFFANSGSSTSSLIFHIFIPKVEKFWSSLTLVYICLFLFLNFYLADGTLGWVDYSLLNYFSFLNENILFGFSRAFLSAN